MTEQDIYKAVTAFRAKHPDYPRPDIKAALIDMDGTLYDSMPLHAVAWHRLASELGINAPREEFFMYEGMTGVATLAYLFKRDFGRVPSDETLRDLYQRKTMYFNELMGFDPERDSKETFVPNVKPMPGARQVVKYLREVGITPVLVTGSGQRTVLDKLDSDYDHAFPANLRVTSHDVKHGKPDPEPYLIGLEKVGVKPWQAIVLENAPLGVESGARAGIFTIAVATGPIPKKALTDAGADIVFKSMPECAEDMPTLIKALSADESDNNVH